MSSSGSQAGLSCSGAASREDEAREQLEEPAGEIEGRDARTARSHTLLQTMDENELAALSPADRLHGVPHTGAPHKPCHAAIIGGPRRRTWDERVYPRQGSSCPRLLPMGWPRKSGRLW